MRSWGREAFFKLSGIGKSCLILMEKYDIRFETISETIFHRDFEVNFAF